MATSNIPVSLTEQQLAAMARICQSHDGKIFMEILEAANDGVNKRLRITTDADFYREQGAGQMLDEIIYKLMTAQESFAGLIAQKAMKPRAL